MRLDEERRYDEHKKKMNQKPQKQPTLCIEIDESLPPLPLKILDVLSLVKN